MSLNRVVITGLGAVSPYGVGVETLYAAMARGQSAITEHPDLKAIKGLRCHIAGLVPELDAREIPRKHRRTMSRMSVFAMLAAMEALKSARIDESLRRSEQTGVIIGTTVGSPQTLQDFFAEYLREFSIEQVKSSLFFKIMGHTCAANVAQALGIGGRVMAPSAACATGVQAIGLGYEAIALGRQGIMLCGGAEELHPLTVGIFDIINAASTGYNTDPGRSPRPFDARRDGTVCSEGGGVLVLESLDSALERGVPILAEIIGFASNSDTTNISTPDPGRIEQCMRLALADAGLEPGQVDYVNAHATATELGDPAECRAIARLFGDAVPVSGFKGHLGHTLAASGALELIAVVRMLQDGLCLPTLNLDQPDPECAMVRHVREPEPRIMDIAVKNNFALGGVNASLIVRKFAEHAARHPERHY
ncbi:3-oxoacyl-[acyl-carrier-protein] synthase II [Desulfonatronum zhilinae]|nr:3-oxoacyl-[acyl-carrier-protein] synthase II [Desulfonatronum zhilinae]